MIDKQRDKIIIPHKAKISELEQKISDLQASELNKIKYIKILQAMLRSPKMCDIFQKAEAQRLSSADLKKADDKAILVLRQEKFFDSNQQEYMDNLVKNVG